LGRRLKAKTEEFVASKSFSYSSALGFGWGVMKDNFLFFVGVSAVLFLISLPGQILRQAMDYFSDVIPPFVAIAMFPASLAIFVVEIIVGIGLIKITLSFCDGKKPAFGTLFSGWDCFWQYLGGGLLCMLIISGAAVASILPFVFLSDAMHKLHLMLPAAVAIVILLVTLSIKFSMWFYFVVDKKLGPVNALRASSRATKGAKFSLFVFGILCGLINLLGMLCFLVGLFATVPTVMLAMAFVYRQLSEQTPELAEFGIEGPKVSPAGVSVQSVGGSQFASIIQSVVNARPDQSVQSGAGIQLGQGVQFCPGVQPGPAARPGEGTSPAPAVRHQSEKKSGLSLMFWINVLIIVSIMLAGGVLYRLWPRPAEAEVLAPSEEDVKVTPKEVSLKGILYSKGHSSAIIYGEIVKEGDTINGIRVLKINKDTVEFEKDGVRWTQRAK
jgi:hypothetical protein